MPDVVREDSLKNQVKQYNTAKMFHYTSAPPKAHPPKINGLARYVANVFSPVQVGSSVRWRLPHDARSVPEQIEMGTKLNGLV